MSSAAVKRLELHSCGEVMQTQSRQGRSEGIACTALPLNQFCGQSPWLAKGTLYRREFGSEIDQTCAPPTHGVPTHQPFEALYSEDGVKQLKSSSCECQEL